MELARSIPTYCYQSRFKTWAYKLIVSRARNDLRWSRAAKRALRPESLEQLPEVDAAVAEAQHREMLARARLLADLVDEVLRSQPDPRMAQIFRLWAIEDKSAVEIGQIVGVGLSRTNALLRETRSL